MPIIICRNFLFHTTTINHSPRDASSAMSYGHQYTFFRPFFCNPIYNNFVLKAFFTACLYCSMVHVFEKGREEHAKTMPRKSLKTQPISITFYGTAINFRLPPTFSILSFRKRMEIFSFDKI